MRLFLADKVGCFLDAVGHSVEKRRGEEVKVLTLTLRVSPFNVNLASDMELDGIKPTLFKLHSGEAKDLLRRADFKASNLDRQVLTVFASPDTEMPSIALDQVRIHGLYARMPKDRTDFDLVCKATFGPVGRTELEFVQLWLLTQRFVTFTEAEASLDFEAVGDEDDLTDADEKARQQALPAPEWDDDGTGTGQPAEETPATRDAKRTVGQRHKLHSHQDKKKNSRRRKPAADAAETVN